MTVPTYGRCVASIPRFLADRPDGAPAVRQPRIDGDRIRDIG
jgi:hypothetical protein